MPPPGIKISGIGPIPSGYILGRTAAGHGDVQLLRASDVAGTTLQGPPGPLPSGFTPGSVLFAKSDGTITQNNTGIFYDIASHSLRLLNGNVEIGGSQVGVLSNGGIVGITASDGLTCFSIDTAKKTTLVGNNTTGDIGYIRNRDGAPLGTNGIAVSIFIYASDTAGGGNAVTEVWSLCSTGLGAIGAALNLVQTKTRGTNPLASVQLADDGVTGGVKITATTAAATVTGAAIRCVIKGMATE